MEISNFSLDWLSFTFKAPADDLEFMTKFWNTFPELASYRNDFVEINGKYYTSGFCLEDDIYIYYDTDNNGKGVNVQVPSHGLYHFFSLFNSPSGLELPTVQEIFTILNSRGCTPSRIDVCFDDFSKKYSPRYYFRKYDSKELLTRMKMIQFFVDPESGGETFCIGSRRKKMVRIYDKEKESDGKIPAIRYEIEMHAISALSFWFHIIENPADCVVYFGDLLTDVFVIKKKSDQDSNRSRWEDNRIWFDFVKSTFSQRYIKVPRYSVEEQIERTEFYIEQNNYSSIYYMIAKHGLTAVLKAIKQKGLSPRYMALLHKFERENNIPPDTLISRCLLNY